MTSSDAKQCKRGSLGRTPALLPVAKSMNADAHCTSEFGLSEVYEIAKRGNIGTGLELALDQPSAKLRGDGSFELMGSELGRISHRILRYDRGRASARAGSPSAR
jgi:hypothetical protein